MNRTRLFQWTLLAWLALWHTTTPVVAALAGAESRQIEARLVPDETTILPGELISISLVLKNKTERAFEIDRAFPSPHGVGPKRTRDGVGVKVVDENGTELPAPKNSAGSFGGSTRTIPARGTCVFRIHPGDWATLEKPGEYTITAGKILSFKESRKGNAAKLRKDVLKNRGEPVEAGKPDFQRNPVSTILPVEAMVRIKVIAADDDKAGELIDKVGGKMLANIGTVPESAMDALASIRDERTIPHWIKALRTGDYRAKYSALTALADYDDDTALAALEEYATLGIDPHDAEIADAKFRSAANLRHAAAFALSVSRNPDAIAFLLNCRHDPYCGVRQVVLRVLGEKVNPGAAAPMLQEMIGDPDKKISSEAKHLYSKISGGSQE